MKGVNFNQGWSGYYTIQGRYIYIYIVEKWLNQSVQVWPSKR